MASHQWVFFFISIFSCYSKSDNGPQEDLAKSSYKKNKEIENLRILFTCWQTKVSTLAIFHLNVNFSPKASRLKSCTISLSRIFQNLKFYMISMHICEGWSIFWNVPILFHCQSNILILSVCQSVYLTGVLGGGGRRGRWSNERPVSIYDGVGSPRFSCTNCLHKTLQPSKG
jgi:hypothetical protein